MADTLEIFGVEYTNVTGIIATNDQSTDLTYIRPQGTKSITQNGTGIDVAEYASVDVAVPSSTPTLQAKTYNVSSAGTATVTADSGYDGLSSVAVTVPSATINDEIIPQNPYFEIVVDSDGLIGASYTDYEHFNIVEEAGFVSDTTYVSTAIYASDDYQLPTQPAKTITPTESSQTAVSSGVYTTGAVTVNAIPSNYVGTGITRRSSSDLTASGATVTVPSGYYSEQASKSVAAVTHANPTASVNSSGLVTASHTQGAGYISAGTTTGTLQLATQAAKTVTPTKSSQQAVASGVYTTGVVTVGAIPAEYITTTDATAAAADIVSGETAYVNGSKVTGSLVINKYYTGSTAPSSSLGSNGDIYLQS